MTVGDYNPYNPLDVSSIAVALAARLTEQQPLPLDGLPKFLGAGSYVLYYDGDFPAYGDLRHRDGNGELDRPIYIGKADPKGRRKAGQGGEDAITDPLVYSPGTELWSRLSKHARSIAAATNLDIDDFYCRYLVITPIFAALGESVLIARYMPVWNAVIDGFGNNDPGSGRYSGLVSKWDVLHPGRGWAERCQPRADSPEQIAEEARQYIRERV